MNASDKFEQAIRSDLIVSTYMAGVQAGLEVSLMIVHRADATQKTGR